MIEREYTSTSSKNDRTEQRKKPDIISADYVLFGYEIDKQIENAFDELHVDEERNHSRLNTIIEAIDKLELTELESVGLSGANLTVKMVVWNGLRGAWNYAREKGGSGLFGLWKRIKDFVDSLLSSLGKILKTIVPVVDVIEEFKHIYHSTRKVIEPSEE